MAMLKATNGMSIDTIGVKFHRVIEIANKESQLSEPEVAILEHFVHSNATVLKNTVYWQDQIIHPVTHGRQDYYKKASTGRITERATGSGAHMREARLRREAAKADQPPKIKRPRGRPRKTP